jgi:hypothetical protein
MKVYMKYGFFLLSVSLLAMNTVMAQPAKERKIFYDFFQNFLHSEEIQRAATKFPLKSCQLDFALKGKSKMACRMLNEPEIEFPVVPKGYSYSPSYDAEKSARVHRDDPVDQRHEFIYHFQKNDLNWQLSAIEDRTLISKDGRLVQNWIEWLFVPSFPRFCGPKNFYYDYEKKRTNTGYMEQRGYAPYKVDEEFAHYKNMHEEFHGFDVVEMKIPSKYSIQFVVVVSANAKDLSKAILKETGQKIQVVKPGYKEELGRAYILQNGRTSLFVCPWPAHAYLFDECDPSDPFYGGGVSCPSDFPISPIR